MLTRKVVRAVFTTMADDDFQKIEFKKRVIVIGSFLKKIYDKSIAIFTTLRDTLPPFFFINNWNNLWTMRDKFYDRIKSHSWKYIYKTRRKCEGIFFIRVTFFKLMGT